MQKTRTVNAVIVLGCALCLGSLTGVVIGQVAPPFFNAGGTIFEPQVSIVTTGTVNDVQATVSADQKYVTLNMRAANSTLLALRQFQFQGPAMGLAGIPAVAAGARPQVARHSSILERQGMTRVDSPN